MAEADDVYATGEFQSDVAEERRTEMPLDEYEKPAALNTYSKPRDRATRVKVGP